VENLTGTTAGDTLIGNGAVNVLTGGSGADTLDGRLQDDQLNGGADSDTASFAGAVPAVVVNLATGQATGQGTDTLTDVQNAVGSNDADTLIDDPAAGNSLDGVGGSDVASFALAPASVTASLETDVATGAGADSLPNVENLIGSPQGDNLTGDAGVNNLAGADGADTITAGLGSDDVFGGNGGDSLLVRDGVADDYDCGAADAAVDTVEADAPAGTDTAANCAGDVINLGVPPVVETPPQTTPPPSTAPLPTPQVVKCKRNQKPKRVKGKVKCVKKKKKKKK
jgi:Ca2+-binding RTX toxin-like protein